VEGGGEVVNRAKKVEGGLKAARNFQVLCSLITVHCYLDWGVFLAIMRECSKQAMQEDYRLLLPKGSHAQEQSRR
jgi:hypothetical protein